MKAGSLFSGLGGIDLAFNRAEIQTVWYSELDKNCNQLLAKKFPDAKSYGDITKFKPDPVQDAVDVIFGGSPCQDLSVAGKRKGMDGERSGLFYQMVRVCKRLRPRIVVWENVPGAFSSNLGRDFACVLRAFTGVQVEVPVDGWGNAGFVRTPYTACRWNVAWRVLDAQHFGVPQRRRRIVLVASFGDASCVEILFEPESVRGDSPPSRETGQRVAGSISARTEGGGGLGTDFETGGGLSKSLKGNTGGIDREDMHTLIPAVVMSHGQANAETVTDGEPSVTCNHEAPILFSCKDHGADAGDTSPTLRSMEFDKSHMNGGGQVAVAIPIQEIGKRLSGTPQNGVGHGKNGEPMYTLQSSCEHGVAIAFDTTQITSKGNYSEPKTGDPCHPIAAGAHPPAIAFKPSHFTRNKDGAPSEIDPPLSADADKGDQDPLIFQSRIARNGRGQPEEICPALNGTDAGETSDMRPLVAFQSSQSGVRESETHATLDSNNGSRRHNGIATETQVRRLTPTECERLQGLPSGWTEGFSDSVRYRMIGNAVAAPVFTWLAKRIASAIRKERTNRDDHAS